MITDGVSFFSIDRAARRQTKTRTLEFNFGDGYTQRLVNGINPLDEKYTVNFVNREESEIEDLILFFELKAGAEKFGFAPPHLNEFTDPGGTNLIQSGGQARVNLFSSGFTDTVLSPSVPDMILIQGSTSNDGGYFLDKTQTQGNNELYIAMAGWPGGSEFLKPITVHAAIAVVATDWTQVYTRDSINGLSVTFERVYEIS